MIHWDKDSARQAANNGLYLTIGRPTILPSIYNIINNNIIYIPELAVAGTYDTLSTLFHQNINIQSYLNINNPVEADHLLNYYLNDAINSHNLKYRPDILQKYEFYHKKYQQILYHKAKALMTEQAGKNLTKRRIIFNE